MKSTIMKRHIVVGIILGLFFFNTVVAVDDDNKVVQELRLNSMKAKFTVSISLHTPPGESVREYREMFYNDVEICFNHHDVDIIINNCYPFNELTHYVDNGFIKLSKDLGDLADDDNDLDDDHPFVNHPDAWDHVVLHNHSSDEDYQINYISLTLYTGSVDDTEPPDRVKDSDDYRFFRINDNFILPHNDKVDFDDEIRDKRIGVVKQAYCGNQKKNKMMEYNPDEECSNCSGKKIGEIGWSNKFPDIVKLAAEDIGQVGTIKYIHNDDGDQNACNEFYKVFSTLACKGNPYTPEDFHEVNRLYTVVFKYRQVSPIPFRDAIEGIYKCTEIEKTGKFSCKCTEWDTNDEYDPKPGDFFFKHVKVWKSDDNKYKQGYHVMMSLSDHGPVYIRGKNDKITLEVLEKGRNVKARTTSYSTNKHQGGPAPYAFAHDFLFGSAITEDPEEWSPGVEYNLGDVVIYMGDLYRCVENHISNSDLAPSMIEEYWKKLKNCIEDQNMWTWEPYLSYEVDQLVEYNGMGYKCLQAHTAYDPNGTPDIVPDLWECLDEWPF